MAIIGKYQLIAELGKGGMANVYLAVMRGHGGFNKLVVLKVPKPEVAQDPNLLAMVVDEARIAAHLSHPNIVQTFQVIRDGSHDIIVMEYLDGYTLNELIGRARKHGTPLPRELHLKVIREALTGLQYAHDAKDFDGAPLNLVHRDVSPHNVFVTFDSQVKILDFGIAKAALQSHQTEIGTFKGKVRYMPREQLAGSSMDRRTDIFAMGVMIWEAAVGERLWAKRSDVEVMSAIIAGTVPMPRDVRPDVPEELDAICRKALAHDKADRYATCIDLQADLDAYLATLPKKPTMREVVTHLETVFVEQRAARRRTIEAQLKTVRLETIDDDTQLASIPPPTGAATLAVSLPALNSTGSGSISTASPITGTGEAGVTTKDVTIVGRSRSSIALVAVSLAALTLGALLFFTQLNRPSGGEAVREPVATSASQVPGVVAPTPPSATLVASDDAPPAVSAEPSVAAVAATPTAATATATAIAAPPATPAARPRWTPPAATPKRHAPPESAPSAIATLDPPGYFSFNTYPWTKVSEGGRVLGTTPLYKVPLKPGTHVLTLENPDESIKSSFTVVIKSGESVNRSMALK